MRINDVVNETANDLGLSDSEYKKMQQSPDWQNIQNHYLYGVPIDDNNVLYYGSDGKTAPVKTAPVKTAPITKTQDFVTQSDLLKDIGEVEAWYNTRGGMPSIDKLVAGNDIDTEFEYEPARPTEIDSDLVNTKKSTHNWNTSSEDTTHSAVVDVYGFKVKNNIKGAPETAKYFLDKIANAMGVSPRTLSMGPLAKNIITFTNKQPDGAYGVHNTIIANPIGLDSEAAPIKSELRIWANQPTTTDSNMENTFFHEFFHHLQSKMGGIDEKGGQRKDTFYSRLPGLMSRPISKMGFDDSFLDDVNDRHSSFTGFGAGKYRAEHFMAMASKSKNKDGKVDRGVWRQNIYDNIVKRKTMKQRPEMKKAWATAFSHLATDPNLLQWSTERYKKKPTGHYRFDPEELGARALAAYVSLANLSDFDRTAAFKGKSHITKETYGHIKNWMNSLKEVHGNTLAMGNTKNNGTKMV
jgi:hypothetical protein